MRSEVSALIDSHAHLDSARYDDDRDALLSRAWDAGVRTVLSIGIGDGPDTMHRALDLCREYAGRTDLPRLYATAGVHPHEAASSRRRCPRQTEQAAAAPEVIACGEIGLDYYYDTAPRDVQQDAFIDQMEIAAATASRSSSTAGLGRAAPEPPGTTRSTCSIATGVRPGSAASCTASPAWSSTPAAPWTSASSSPSPATSPFPRRKPIRDAAQALPLTSMLVETDAPFLAPVPYRGQRNEPAYVAGTAAKLAELLGVDPEEIAATTTRNFETLMRFGS